MPALIELDVLEMRQDPFYGLGLKHGKIKVMILMVQMKRLKSIEAAEMLGMPEEKFNMYMNQNELCER